MRPHGAAWQNAYKYSDIKGGVNKSIIFHSVEKKREKIREVKREKK